MERPTLTDGVLTLRPNRLADADAITAGCQDPEVQRWALALPVPYHRSDAVAYIEGSVQAAADGSSFNFAAVVDGRVLGSMSVFGGEIGYWVAREARGRGIATRGVVLLRDWAHAALGLGRVELLIDPRNEASLRVAARAGFADSGERRTPSRGRNPGPHAVYVWSAA